MAPRGVIFDCDGTLVDSEPLSALVFAEALAEQGLEITPAAALDAFRGRRFALCVAMAERMLGRTLPPDFEAMVRDRTTLAFRDRLRGIEGAAALLEAMPLPFCVASNAPRAKTELSLTLTGLRHFFGERIFSAYDVGSWKPDPGLFLHAADALGLPPADCLVVEDSEAGVMAGLAAGMRVVALLSDLPREGRPGWLPAEVPALEGLAAVRLHL
ncbi:HAD family hydrolase [Falsiroseomonas sp.]|uniref:HAD family hydrolase n=1 Tax=Falsiroseomonas sp. TaxID=2870721 RepID=UPI003F6F8B77